MNLHRIFAVGALAAAACSGAWAQSAGSFQLRGGFINITPDVSSGNLSAPSLPGTKIDVRDNTQPGGGLTYMLTEQWALDLPLATPYSFDIVGAGAINGVGKLATAKALPVTLLVQYRFGEAQAAFRPYVAAGLTYAKFYNVRTTNVLNTISGGTPSNPTTLNIQSKLAPTFGVGAVYVFNERWFVEGAVTKTLLTNNNTLSTGQTIRTRLNPSSLAFSVGYRF